MVFGEGNNVLLAVLFKCQRNLCTGSQSILKHLFTVSGSTQTVLYIPEDLLLARHFECS